jgi:hypothetical protein
LSEGEGLKRLSPSFLINLILEKENKCQTDLQKVRL